jgi:soluble lytic murein transglycosylase
VKRGKFRITPFKTLVALLVAGIVVAAAFAAVQLADRVYLRYRMEQYPLKYTDLVEQNATEFGIDKYLLYAIIKTESGFKPNAESNVGARGLMQLMEETCDWIAWRTGEELTFDDMFNPADNIRCGAYLMDYLLTEFGNVKAAVAAYHAGSGNVGKWLADPEYSSDGSTLQDIPISDTAHYVNKINKAYSEYINLYT